MLVCRINFICQKLRLTGLLNREEDLTISQLLFLSISSSSFIMYESCDPQLVKLFYKVIINYSATLGLLSRQFTDAPQPLLTLLGNTICLGISRKWLSHSRCCVYYYICIYVHTNIGLRWYSEIHTIFQLC